MDIIETASGSQTGFLAVDAMEYAECIARILYNTPEENDVIRKAARYIFKKKKTKIFLYNFHIFLQSFV